MTTSAVADRWDLPDRCDDLAHIAGHDPDPLRRDAAFERLLPCIDRVAKTLELSFRNTAAAHIVDAAPGTIWPVTPKYNRSKGGFRPPWDAKSDPVVELGQFRVINDSAADDQGIARSFCTIHFDLKLRELFLTNDTVLATRSGFDHVPLLEVASRDGVPILPGAGLRGALRSQAERLARTLSTLESADQKEFLNTCPACNPVESREDQPLANCDSLLREATRRARAAEAGEDAVDEEVETVQLCLACRLFGSTRWGSRLIVEDATAQGSVARKVLDFLAIDRFTGGGKDGAKFDAIALWQPTFSVRLHLDNPEPWELGWLWLALRDLADGLVAVGFGAAKGFGRSAVSDLKLSCGFVAPADFPSMGSPAPTDRAQQSGIYRVATWNVPELQRPEGVGDLPQRWVDEFHRVRKEFRRSDDPDLRCTPCLRRDSFFGTSAEKLYGKARVRP